MTYRYRQLGQRVSENHDSPQRCLAKGSKKVIDDAKGAVQKTLNNALQHVSFFNALHKKTRGSAAVNSRIMDFFSLVKMERPTRRYLSLDAFILVYLAHPPTHMRRVPSEMIKLDHVGIALLAVIAIISTRHAPQRTNSNNSRRI